MEMHDEREIEREIRDEENICVPNVLFNTSVLKQMLVSMYNNMFFFQHPCYYVQS